MLLLSKHASSLTGLAICLCLVKSKLGLHKLAVRGRQ